MPTLADTLQLEELKGAKVVAGSDGLTAKSAGFTSPACRTRPTGSTAANWC